MLKFSGFADLTSCLGEKAAKRRPMETKGTAQSETKKDIEKTLTCLTAREFPYALDASKAEALRCTDTHRQHLPDESQESAAGMIRSRH